MCSCSHTLDWLNKQTHTQFGNDAGNQMIVINDSESEDKLFAMTSYRIPLEGERESSLKTSALKEVYALNVLNMIRQNHLHTWTEAGGWHIWFIKTDCFSLIKSNNDIAPLPTCLSSNGKFPPPIRPYLVYGFTRTSRDKQTPEQDQIQTTDRSWFIHETWFARSNIGLDDDKKKEFRFDCHVLSAIREIEGSIKILPNA